MSTANMPFITGSRAYGTPRKNSDVDLVVRMDRETAMAMLRHSGVDVDDDDYEGAPGISLRFGDLNLLCALTDRAYDQWAVGTHVLQKRAPVDRHEAVRVFRDIRGQDGDPVWREDGREYRAIDGSVHEMNDSAE